MIDDKNISVLLSTLDLFSIGMKKLKPIPVKPITLFIDEILERLSDYLGHPNDKVKRAAEEIYFTLPSYELTNKEVCYESLTRIGKRDKPPKILTGRLKTLSQLVSSFQLSKNYENIIRYSLKYADDKNS
jgi:hypothetical protein